MLIQTLQIEPGVEGLDLGFIGELAGTAEVKLYVIPISPHIDILRDELGAVINLNNSILSS